MAKSCKELYNTATLLVYIYCPNRVQDGCTQVVDVRRVLTLPMEGSLAVNNKILLKTSRRDNKKFKKLEISEIRKFPDFI